MEELVEDFTELNQIHSNRPLIVFDFLPTPTQLRIKALEMVSRPRAQWRYNCEDRVVVTQGIRADKQNQWIVTHPQWAQQLNLLDDRHGIYSYCVRLRDLWHEIRTEEIQDNSESVQTALQNGYVDQPVTERTRRRAKRLLGTTARLMYLTVRQYHHTLRNRGPAPQPRGPPPPQPPDGPQPPPAPRGPPGPTQQITFLPTYMQLIEKCIFDNYILEERVVSLDDIPNVRNEWQNTHPDWEQQLANLDRRAYRARLQELVEALQEALDEFIRSPHLYDHMPVELMPGLNMVDFHEFQMNVHVNIYRLQQIIATL